MADTGDDPRRSLTGAVWDIAPRAPAALFAEIDELPPLAVQVLHNRGHDSAEKLQEFMLGPLPPHDPYLLDEMDLAVARIAQAMHKRERVCIYGDYDVDGVSATAMLLETAEALGLDAFPYIPERLTEGYGLHAGAIDAVAQERATLIITVDCGATADEEIDRAAAAGVDVIVTDHHPTESRPAKAAALLNPKAPGSGYPFGGLSGVGVAYKLVQALADEFPEQLPDPERFLDLVALGTLADVAPIRDENRAYVMEGLEWMRASPRPGLRALAEAARRQPESIRSDDIAFALAPRLNAAGRLASPQLALELLQARHPVRAAEIADELNELNAERRRLTEDVMDAARAMVDGSPVIFAADPGFAPGVVGLAASRLCEEFGAPAFIGAEIDGLVHGSARAPDGFNLRDLLRHQGDWLENWGGHAGAAGFSVLPQNVQALRRGLSQALASLDLPKFSGPSLRADGRVYPSTISWETYRALELLGPWGQEHEEPRLVVENVRIQNTRLVGEDHVVLQFEELARNVEAIWFRHGDQQAALGPGRCVDVAFRLGLRTFRGETRLQMLVDDIRLRPV